MKPLAQERSPAADSKDTRAHRIEAVVVSNDDALLIELGPILGNRYRTHTVDTPAEIAAAVRAPRWIGIVDVGSLADARGAVARLELQYHRCPLIIVAANPEEWAGAVARGAASAAVARHELAGVRLNEALSAAEARLRADSVPESTPAAVDPARVCLFGVRSIDPAEAATLPAAGITVHDMRAVETRGVAALLGPFLDRALAARGLLHVSFDIDCLDPEIAPAVGTAVSRGIGLHDAYAIAETLRDSGLVGSLDLVELNPALDEAGRTAALMIDLTARLAGRVTDRVVGSDAA